MWQCIFLEPTNLSEVYLRRYVSGSAEKCPVHGYHNTMFSLGRFEKFYVETMRKKRIEDDDPRWPSVCECGRAFASQDVRQFFEMELFKDAASGQMYTLRDAPIGAMWYADWMSDCHSLKGPDDRILVVRVPEGNGKAHDWMPDGRAKNCGSACLTCKQPYKVHVNGRCPDNPENHYQDSQPKHKCWIRHGTPPMITVDKNGHTCDAGAGSIQTNGWHGFLRNGQLVE